MFAKDMAPLFRGAYPNMTVDEKLCCLMRGVNEELFAGFVRNFPSMPADFILEVTDVEQTLHLRSRWCDRLPTAPLLIPLR